MRLLRILITVDAFLVALHLALGSKISLFHLEAERTFASYWSGWQLFATSFLGIVMLGLSWRQATSERPFWFLWSGLFLYLGFDEISELHENITYYLNKAFHLAAFFQHPTFNWLLLLSPVILLALIFFVTFLRYWFRQQRRITWWFAAGVGCFVGALAMELLGGVVYKSQLYDGLQLYVIEESLEMLGGSIFLTTMLFVARERFALLYAPRT